MWSARPGSAPARAGRDRPVAHERGHRVPVQRVEHRRRGEPAVGDAEAGEAEGMGDRARAVDADVRREPAGGVDESGPAVGEPQPVQLREGLAEVVGEQPVRGVALLQRDVGPGAVVVDRVVATPQDPPVRERPVVVELVPRVGHSLPVRPAQRSPLLGRQRLGDQDVVVDRHDVLAQPAHRVAERVGGHHDLTRPYLRLRGHHDGAVEADDRRLLVDAHPQPQGPVPQAHGEGDGVHHSPAGAHPDAAEVRRGVDVGAHARRVEQLGVLAVAAEQLGQSGRDAAW